MCRVLHLREVLNEDRYDWWPPYHPIEVSRLEGAQIVHPVLSGDKYINSLLRYDRILPETWFDEFNHAA
jgi:hypothetical protein